MMLSRHDYEYSVTGGRTTIQPASWPPMAAPKGPRRTMKSLSQAIEENIGSDQGLVQGTVEDDDGFDSYLFAVVGQRTGEETSGEAKGSTESDEEDFGPRAVERATSSSRRGYEQHGTRYTVDGGAHNAAIARLKAISFENKASVECQDVQEKLEERMKALSKGTSQLTYLYRGENGACDVMDKNQRDMLVETPGAFSQLGTGEIQSVWLIKVAPDDFDLTEHLRSATSLDLVAATQQLDGLSLQPDSEHEEQKDD